MEKKYLLISMEDERAKHLSEVLGNKTCKKIIDILAETNELSEKDLADKLNMPLNTVEYNLNKLIKAEIVEKTKNFFWSSKGKKIPTYKLSNKSIIISPGSSRVSSKIKSILPVAVLSLAGALIARTVYLSQTAVQKSVEAGEDAIFAESASKGAQIMAENGNSILSSQIFSWFLAGAIFALIIFAILNWRKL